MARNEEKQFCRLNRMILQKQKEENETKNPPRPKLWQLECIEDIKKWLPSIKRDIDFNLKQSEVTCYPERKVNEFRREVERLQREYQAFVGKLHRMGPQCAVTPWTDRPYTTRKKPHDPDKISLKYTSDTSDKKACMTGDTSHDVQSLLVNFKDTGRLTLPILEAQCEMQYAHGKANPHKEKSRDEQSPDEQSRDERLPQSVHSADSTPHLIYSSINLESQDAPLQFASLLPDNLHLPGLNYSSSSDSEDS